MKFSYINLMVTMFVAIAPIIILKKREYLKKNNLLYLLLFSIAVGFISIGILSIIKAEIVLITLIPTLIISSIFNYLILENKIDVNKLPKTLLIILLFLLSSLFQYIPVLLFNIDLNNLNGFTSVCLTVFSDLCLLLILFFVYKKELVSSFKDYKKNFNKYIDIGFKYWVFGLIIMMVSNILIGLVSPNEIANNEKEVRELISATPYLMLFTAGVLAPILEEITFRFSIRETFVNDKLFIFVSGLVFGLLHVVFSYTSLWDFLYVIPYGVLGGCFAAILCKTNNIFASISMHMLHNIIFTITSIIALMLVVL